jgi:hypothetical protein
LLAKAAALADKQLATDAAEPLQKHLTPHSLRRTFASLLFAIGETPPYVMAQMGHTTPNLTLSIYARQMDRRDGEPERLKALVEGRVRESVHTDLQRFVTTDTELATSNPVVNQCASRSSGFAGTPPRVGIDPATKRG